jgi:hypothetical protein
VVVDPVNVEEALAKEIALAGLFVCGSCGGLVTGKELIAGSWEPSDEAAVYRRRVPDRLGPNVPCGHDALAISVDSDADSLRRAAAILRRRSRKPDGLWMRVLVRVLTDEAEKIEAEEAVPTAVKPSPSRRTKHGRW